MTTSQIPKRAAAQRLDREWREAFRRQQAHDTPRRAAAETEAWNALRDGRTTLEMCLEPYCFNDHPCPVHDD